MPPVRSRVAGAQIRRRGQADPPEDLPEQEVQEPVLEPPEGEVGEREGVEVRLDEKG